MVRNTEFLDYVLDHMAFIPGLHARGMFGGHGIYQDGIIFALIIDDSLYLKANDDTRPTFEAEGLAPFRYAARGRTVALPYFEAPAEVFEDADTMRFWADKALRAALASPSRAAGKTKRRSGSG